MNHTPQSEGRNRRVALLALIVLAGTVACTKVWNYDVFWHLAAGDWMLHHGHVLRTDPFAVSETPVGQTPWLNVHWLFQVVISLLHGAGGFAALTALKMVLLAALAVVLALIVGRRAGGGWLTLCGLWMILGVETRVRVRPEVFSMVFLLATLGIVESVRLGRSPRRLWWLLPIFAVWVNMHGLYFLGPLAAVAGWAGCAIDRRLRRHALPSQGTDTNPPLPRGAKGQAADAQGADNRGSRAEWVRWGLPIVAAIAACFIVSPFPVSAALHPATLASRVIGAGGMYKVGVQELRPTYLCYPLTHIPVLIAGLLAVATIATMAIRWRTLPCAHIVWLVLFLAIGLLAVRNTPFFVIPAAMLLALHGPRLGQRQARNPESEIRSKFKAPNGRETPAATAPCACRLPFRICLGFRFSDFAFLAILLIVAALAAAYATESVYRWQRRPESRVGFGLVEGVHPVEMARWLDRLPQSGAVLPLEFGHGSTMMYFCPSRKVWMDGRLEVHSAERFRRLELIRRQLDLGRRAGDPERAPLPPEARFIIVGLSQSRHIESLNRWPSRFRWVYADRTGVCFARIPQPGERVAWPADPPVARTNLDELDRPLRPELSALLPVETRRHWWRQNVPPAHWQTGVVLNMLSADAIAWRYLAVAERLKLAGPTQRVRMLAQSHQRLGELRPIRPVTGFPADPKSQAASFPADPNLSRAFALYDRLEAMNLDAEEAHAVALARMRGQMLSHQFDAAAVTADRLEKMGPAATEDEETVGSCRSARLMAAAARLKWLKAKDEPDFPARFPGERALLLRDFGLIEGAIAELEGEPGLPPFAVRQLGDYYLQTGQVGRARQAYARLDGQQWQVKGRLGLCDWAEGDLAGAIRLLAEAAEGAGEESLVPRALLAALHEQLGDYATALKLAGAYASLDSDPCLPAEAAGPQRVLRHVAARLLRRAGEEGP